MKKIINILIANFIFASILFAQPTITNLSPTSGAIGTTVTITGTNFSSTIVNNIVWFGGVKATVTSSTATSLTTTVPVGATHSPIRVLVNGLITESPKAFNITFIFGDISLTSIAPKVDFATGNLPYATALGDFDGDGKLDMAVTNYGSTTVSVYRNISTTGTVASSSFATKVDFATVERPAGISIGDLDGDGKLDMAITDDASNKVSVYRNTSTSGSVSFATKVDFEAGGGTTGILLGDLDGDGKLDIFVTNWGSNRMSVYRNTSEVGSLTTASFASSVVFGNGNSPYRVSLGDLDGDGKLDMAITDNAANKVSVFRNISTSGSITTSSFATKVDFVTGSSPKGITLGDLDGDGKLDIAVTNSSSSTISVFRNTSTSGSLTTSSFEAKVDFTTLTNPLGISLGDLDGDGKLDIAVANNGSAKMSVYKNTSTSGSLTTSSFASKVDFATGTTPQEILLGDIDGNGKLDIAVANFNSNTVSVLRNIGIPPPTIISFTPTTSGAGATVTITGTNFTGATAVTIGGTNATSFTVVSATSITAVVGSGATGTISLTTPGGTVTSSGTFTFIPAPTSSPTLVHPLTNAINRPVSDTLKWKSVTGATSYQLQMATAGNFGATTKDTTRSDTTFYLTGLTNNTKYFWRVRGKNIAGDGPFAIDSFTTVKQKYLITSTSNSNGTITPSGDTLVTHGDSVTYVMQANIGNQIDSIFHNNVKVWETNKRNQQTETHTFRNVTAPNTISVYFGVAKLLVKSSSSPNGKITPVGDTVLNYGSSLTYKIKPNFGYYTDSIIVNGTKVTTDTAYSFTNITSDQTIKATFNKGKAVITLSTRLIKYDTVMVGVKFSKPITVTNTGIDTLFITKWESISPDYHVNPPQASAFLLPNQSHTDSIWFKPTLVGMRFGKIVIMTNVGTDSIALEGYGKGKAILKFEPVTLLDFGLVRLNGNKVLSLKVRNEGNDTLRIKELFSNNPQEFMAILPPPIGMFIKPMGELNIDITATPKQLGMRSGKLVVSHNEGRDSLLLVARSYGEPKLKLFVSKIDFGPVKQTLTKDTMLVIKNEGDDTLKVIMQSSSTLFTIMNPAIIRMIQPNMEIKEPIKFTPTTLGSIAGMLYLRSNHMNPPPQTPKVDSIELVASVVTKVQVGIEIPKNYSITQNYPNPFNPSTTIRFGLPNESFVKLEIYNSLGQLVQTLVDEVMSAHYYEVKWEAGKNPTGLYFYKIIATDINNPNNKLIQTKKMMLVK